MILKTVFTEMAFAAVALFAQAAPQVAPNKPSVVDIKQDVGSKITAAMEAAQIGQMTSSLPGQQTQTIAPGNSSTIDAQKASALDTMLEMRYADIFKKGEQDIALFEAAEKNDLDAIKFLLKKNANVNTTNYGNTSLMRAAEVGHLEAVKLLLENGADIDRQDLNGKTVLQKAVTSGNPKVVAFILDQHPNLYVVDNYGRNVMHEAVEKGNKAIVQMILGSGGMGLVNQKDEHGQTPFSQVLGHFKNGKNIRDMVLLMLESGADPNAKRESNITVLHDAALQGHEEVMNLLLQFGANPDLRTGTEEDAKNPSPDIGDAKGKTPLIFMAGSDHPKLRTADLLLSQKNAEVDASDTAGMTALIWAARYGNEGLVEFLLAKGSDINHKDKAGKTALNHAQEMIDGETQNNLSSASKYKQLIKFLQDVKASIRTPQNRVEEEPYPPNLDAPDLTSLSTTSDYALTSTQMGSVKHDALYEAVKYDDVEQAAKLIRNGADPNMRYEPTGTTLLMLAAENDDANMIKTLIAAGIDVNAREGKASDEGTQWTAVHYAAERNCLDALKTLIDAGADLEARDGSRHRGMRAFDRAMARGNFVTAAILKTAMERALPKPPQPKPIIPKGIELK